MDILRRILFVVVFLVAGAAWGKPKALVVLVPGFGSGLLHEIPEHDLPPESVSSYFGETLASTMIEGGYEVFAVTDLGSAADFSINGDKAIDQIETYVAKYQDQIPPIYILGHSMGGLLALYITDQIGTQLPIKKIVMLSTPLKGSQVANKIANGIISLKVAEKAAEALSGIVDLRGIVQMTTPKVEAFLADLRLPMGIDIRAFSGYQPKNRFVLPSWEAPVQSPLYYLLAKIVGEDSDGVVGLSSSLPKSLAIASTGKNRLVVKSEKLIAELDHEEQHMDSRAIENLFLTDGIEYIDKKQREFYQQMILCWELPSCSKMAN